MSAKGIEWEDTRPEHLKEQGGAVSVFSYLLSKNVSPFEAVNA